MKDWNYIVEHTGRGPISFSPHGQLRRPWSWKVPERMKEEPIERNAESNGIR